MSSDVSKVFKPQVPVSLWIKALTLGAVVFAFILFAVWQAGIPIADAKLTGTIVSKEYKPTEQVDRQITIHRKGSVRSDVVDGEYLITVAVPQKTGEPKNYLVWINDKKRFEALKIGEAFDVGPYLIRD